MSKASAILVCPTVPLRQLPDPEREGKCCTKCGEFKEAAAFNRMSRVKSGLSSWCKACVNASTAAAQERHAAANSPVLQSKCCSHCRQIKPAAEFYASPTRKDGLSSRCKDCTKTLANEWAEQNRELSRTKANAWRAVNPERHRRNGASWRERNRERKRANDARHYRENKGRWRLYAEQRRARKQSAPGRVSRDIVQKLLRLQRGKCACCGRPLGVGFHLDHVLPLVLGGRHDDSNLQLLRAKCNLQKNRKHPVDFMRERGFLL